MNSGTLPVGGDVGDDPNTSLAERFFFAPMCQLVEFPDAIAVVRGGHRCLIRSDADLGVARRMLGLCARRSGASHRQILALFPRGQRAVAERLLRDLSEAGVLLSARARPGRAPRPYSEEYYHSLFGADPQRLKDFVGTAHITVIGGGPAVEAIVAGLERAGLRAYVRSVPQPWPDAAEPTGADRCWDGRSVAIFVSETGDPLAMLRAGQAAWCGGKAFIPVILAGWICSIGPSVVPPSGPCARCLVLRQNSAMEDPGRMRLLEVRLDPDASACKFLTPTLSLAIGAIAVARVLALAGRPSDFGGHYHALRVDDLSVEMVQLLEVP